MNNTEKIKAIHNSNLFGIIVECGNGACITNSLYEVNGASKTIYYSKQPYSKEYQDILYRNLGFNNVRSISYEFLNKVHCGESILLDYELICNGKLNFILSSTFQIQGKDNILTHGWIGLEEVLHPDIDVKNVKRTFYHISIPKPMNGSVFTERKEFFDIISSIAIDLLYSKVESTFNFYSRYVDNVVTLNYKGDIINEDEDKLLLLNNLNNLSSNEENLVYINSESKVLRFEDLCRDQKGVIMMKGSFNPLHVGHVGILEASKKVFPNYQSVFYVSIGNRDKNDMDEKELLKRIKNINQHGYGVVVSRQPMFIDNIKWIRNRYTLPLVFPVGYDTINRFIDDCVKEIMSINEGKIICSTKSYLKKQKVENVTFLIFHRDGYKLTEEIKYFQDIIQIEPMYKDEGISSSKIRSGEIENKMDQKIKKQL